MGKVVSNSTATAGDPLGLTEDMANKQTTFNNEM